MMTAGSEPFRSSCMAFDRIVSKLTLVCTKLAALALGKVFLKRSKASSSLRTLIVSANATNSSARVLDLSSHSAVFVAQLFSRFAKNSLSAISAASVSVKSSFISTISMPSSPICLSFFVRNQCSLSVGQVLLHLNNFNAKFADLLEFLLYRSCQRIDFFLLCSHQVIIGFDRFFFSLGCTRQISCHCIAHLLQDSNYLA